MSVRVRVVAEWSSFNGQEGHVVGEVSPPGMFAILLDGTTENVYFSATELKVVDSSSTSVLK